MILPIGRILIDPRFGVFRELGGGIDVRIHTAKNNKKSINATILKDEPVFEPNK